MFQFVLNSLGLIIHHTPFTLKILPVWAINYTVTLSSTSKRALRQETVNGEPEKSITRSKALVVQSYSQAGSCPAGPPENWTVVEEDTASHCPV